MSEHEERLQRNEPLERQTPSPVGDTVAQSTEAIPMPPPPPDAVPSPTASADAPAKSQSSRDSTTDSEWSTLREMALWQRRMNLAALVGVVLGSDGFGLLGKIPLFVDIPFVCLLAWVTVMLARPLRLTIWVYVAFGVLLLGLIMPRGTLANVMFMPSLLELGIVASVGVFIYLNLRAKKALESAGFRVGFLGTKLPEQPPQWFGTTGGSPFTPSAGRVATAAPHSGALTKTVSRNHTGVEEGRCSQPRQSLLTQWRKRCFRGFLGGLLGGIGLFVLVGIVDMEAESTFAMLVLVLAWVAFIGGIVSFFAFLAVGAIELVLGVARRGTSAQKPRA